jgi:hypothetical protein
MFAEKALTRDQVGDMEISNSFNLESIYGTSAA